MKHVARVTYTLRLYMYGTTTIQYMVNANLKYDDRHVAHITRTRTRTRRRDEETWKSSWVRVLASLFPSLSLSAYVVRGRGEGGGIKVMDKLWRKRKRGRRTRAHVLAYSNQRRRSQRQLTPLPHPTGAELPSIYNTLAWIIIIMCRTAHKHVKAQEIRVYNSLGGSWT